MKTAWCVAAVIFIIARGSPATTIAEIQGTTHLSPLRDRAVDGVSGLVTAVGVHLFYLQSPSEDGDERTSQGIRVKSDEHVRVGDLVTADGTVRESRFGCRSCSARDSAFSNLSTTELEASAVSVLSSGHTLPDAVNWLARSGSAAPPDPDSAAATIDVESSSEDLDPRARLLDLAESLEGMRVTLGASHVTSAPRAVLGAQELGIMVDGTREPLIVADGAQTELFQADRGDAIANGISGVLDYRAGHYALVAASPFATTQAALPWSPPESLSNAGELTVATFNLHNFSAVSAAVQRDGLASIIVGELGSPDLVIVQEVQDNSGPRDDGTTDADVTAQALVDAIGARGGPRYAYTDVAPEDGADGGEPGGNIRVGLLVRPSADVKLIAEHSDDRERDPNWVGEPPHLTASPARLGAQATAFTDSRKPLVVELLVGGEALFVVGCHWIAQSADPPRYGRYQPPKRVSRAARTAQAELVARFVASLLERDTSARVIVAGDLNDIPGSPPLSRLVVAGVHDVLSDVPDELRVTHVYDGRGEALDHVLVSRALGAQLVEAHVASTNAGRRHAASDHDAIVARFRMAPVVAVPERALHCAGAAVRPRMPSAKVGALCAFGLALLASVRRRTGGGRCCPTRASRV